MYLVSNKICINIFLVVFLELWHLLILRQFGFNYSANNHHVPTAVLKEENMRTGSDPVHERQ